MSQDQSLDIRRLADVDEWEFYAVTVGGDEADSYTIGLRPYPEFGAVEFECWDGGEEQPWDTGSVPCAETGSGWSSAAIETLIECVIADRE